jgi:hypothetical protein
VNYHVKGPLPTVTRDKDGKKTKGMAELAEHSAATLQVTQMWIITQNIQYANKAIVILNAWGQNLRTVNGTTAST